MSIEGHETKTISTQRFGDVTKTVRWCPDCGAVIVDYERPDKNDRYWLYPRPVI